MKFFFILVTCLPDVVVYCMEKFCLSHSWERPRFIKYLFGANIYMNIFRCALQVTNPPNPTQGRTSITQ